MNTAMTSIAWAIHHTWPHIHPSEIEHRMLADSWAAADEAMSLSQCLDLALFAHTATQALQLGQATDVDINNLAMISNVAMLLSERGYGEELLDDIIAGQVAVKTTFDRYARTGRIGCSGPELHAIRTLVDIHDQQLHLGPTQREMLAVIAEMRRRLAGGNVIGGAQ